MESMSWMEPPVFFPTSSTPSTCPSSARTASTTDSRRLTALTPSPRTYMYPDHGSGDQAGGVARSCAASLEEEASPANYGALVAEHIRRACEASRGAASQAGAPGATTPPTPSTVRSLLSSPDVRVAFSALIKVSNCVQQVHLEIRSLCGTQQPHAGNLADASFRKRAVAAYLVLRCITQIAEATIVPHPDNLFVLLCMYNPLADLFDFALSMFLPILEQLSVDSSDSFSARFHDTLLVLRSTIRCSLDVLETKILVYPSKQVRAGGGCGVDEITEYLTKYIKLLLEHSSLLSVILANGKSEQAVRPLQGGAGMSTLDDAVAVLISCLETAIEKKSRLYPAADGLQWLFLVNNAHDILKQVESSDMKSLLGDDWILKRREQLEDYISRYIDIAWAHILSWLEVKPTRIPFCFNRPALPTLSRFNRLFLEKHRRRPPKYMKYTPEEIEEQLSELDAVLEAVKFPARVPDLDAGLPDVDRDALPHLRFKGFLSKRSGEKERGRKIDRA